MCDRPRATQNPVRQPVGIDRSPRVLCKAVPRFEESERIGVRTNRTPRAPDDSELFPLTTIVLLRTCSTHDEDEDPVAATELSGGYPLSRFPTQLGLAFTSPSTRSCCGRNAGESTALGPPQG